MLGGILLGSFVLNTGPALQKAHFMGVSVPIGTFSVAGMLERVTDRRQAVSLLAMMCPILCKVRFETLHHSFRARTLWTQVAFSIFVNWIMAPFVMECDVWKSWSNNC